LRRIHLGLGLGLGLGEEKETFIENSRKYTLLDEIPFCPSSMARLYSRGRRRGDERGQALREAKKMLWLADI